MPDKNSLTEEQKNNLVEYFEGSCNSAYDFEHDEENPISEETVLEVLIEAETELCSACSWWCHQSEMELVDGEPTCDQCREEADYTGEED